MRFYLSGQRTFGNRGCEAIVRSTVAILRRTHCDLTVLVPSDDIEGDSAQWPEAAASGVEFVSAYLPPHLRYWVHSQRLPISALKRASWPFPFPRWIKEQLDSVDAVLSVGGDNYSLDYRLPSLLMGLDGLAMEMGKPVILWGASVGPFEREPHFVPAIQRHLACMNQILVRESVSFDYLTRTLGLTNVVQMVDPAFTLAKQAVDCAPFWPQDPGNGVIGLNVSPLIERYKKPEQALVTEASNFVREAVTEHGHGILLVPHVIPLDESTKNNDAHYMTQILTTCADLGASVTMAPPSFNASQIKAVIGCLRFFIGARTHATIAALSSGVPTVSIAYSVKARGINRDLFGGEEMVLPTPELTKQSLLSKLGYLHRHEGELKSILAEQIPRYAERVHQAAASVKIAHA